MYNTDLNRLKKLIRKNGLPNDLFREKKKRLLRSLARVNHSLLRGEPSAIACVRRLNKRLPGKIVGEQQLAYLLKRVNPERKLWKKHMPNLRFRRLSREELGGQKWIEPRYKKKNDTPPKGQKMVNSLNFVASFRKLLKQDGADTILEGFRGKLPFGSPAYLQPNLRAHHEAVRTKLRYSDHKGMLDHCAFAKIGKGALPRMGHERFVARNTSFLSTYTLPEKEGENRMADWRVKMKKAAERGSDSDSEAGSDAGSDAGSEAGSEADV